MFQIFSACYQTKTKKCVVTENLIAVVSFYTSKKNNKFIPVLINTRCKESSLM